MTQSRGAVEPPFFKRSVQLTIAIAALGASMIQGIWLSRLLRQEVGWNSQASGQPLKGESPGRDRPLIQIDLNRAQARELTLLPGVGPVLARRIVENRNRLGPFESVDALARVDGIGDKTIERIRPIGYVDRDTPRRAIPAETASPLTRPTETRLGVAFETLERSDRMQ